MPSAPAASAARAFSMAWAVEPPAEARTGTMRADFLDGGADHALGFGRSQGEALAGSAGGEQSRNREAGLPGEVLAVVLLVELQLRVERGDGEGEQAVLEGVGQFLGCVFCHDVSSGWAP